MIPVFWLPGWYVEIYVLWSDILKVVQRPFYERWKMLEKEVIEPRNHERHAIFELRNTERHSLQLKHPDYRYDLEPFRVHINIYNF